MQKKQRNT